MKFSVFVLLLCVFAVVTHGQAVMTASQDYVSGDTHQPDFFGTCSASDYPHLDGAISFTPAGECYSRLLRTLTLKVDEDPSGVHFRIINLEPVTALSGSDFVGMAWTTGGDPDSELRLQI